MKQPTTRLNETVWINPQRVESVKTISTTGGVGTLVTMFSGDTHVIEEPITTVVMLLAGHQ